MNNGRIAVLCPSRDRPAGMELMARSVMKTAEKADVIFYADDDQYELYHGIEKKDGLRGRTRDWYGPRIGPLPACNLLAQKYPDYAIYGMITDDAIVMSPGWDKWCLESIDYFNGRLCVISPHHNWGDHVDMPFVTQEWIRQTGWFGCPMMYHYAWPIVTGLIGEMTGIIHAPEDKFHIHHEYVDGTYNERRDRDNAEFFNYVSLHMMPVVDRIRGAMR